MAQEVRNDGARAVGDGNRAVFDVVGGEQETIGWRNCAAVPEHWGNYAGYTAVVGAELCGVVYMGVDKHGGFRAVVGPA